MYSHTLSLCFDLESSDWQSGLGVSTIDHASGGAAPGGDCLRGASVLAVTAQTA